MSVFSADRATDRFVAVGPTSEFGVGDVVVYETVSAQHKWAWCVGTVREIHGCSHAAESDDKSSISPATTACCNPNVLVTVTNWVVHCCNQLDEVPHCIEGSDTLADDDSLSPTPTSSSSYSRRRRSARVMHSALHKAYVSYDASNAANATSTSHALHATTCDKHEHNHQSFSHGCIEVQDAATVKEENDATDGSISFAASSATDFSGTVTTAAAVLVTTGTPQRLHAVCSSDVGPHEQPGEDAALASKGTINSTTSNTRECNSVSVLQSSHLVNRSIRGTSESSHVHTAETKRAIWEQSGVRKATANTKQPHRHVYANPRRISGVSVRPAHSAGSDDAARSLLGLTFTPGSGTRTVLCASIFGLICAGAVHDTTAVRSSEPLDTTAACGMQTRERQIYQPAVSSICENSSNISNSSCIVLDCEAVLSLLEHAAHIPGVAHKERSGETVQRVHNGSVAPILVPAGVSDDTCVVHPEGDDKENEEHDAVVCHAGVFGTKDETHKDCESVMVDRVSARQMALHGTMNACTPRIEEASRSTLHRGSPAHETGRPQQEQEQEEEYACSTRGVTACAPDGKLLCLMNTLSLFNLLHEEHAGRSQIEKDALLTQVGHYSALLQGTMSSLHRAYLSSSASSVHAAHTDSAIRPITAVHPCCAEEDGSTTVESAHVESSELTPSEVYCMDLARTYATAMERLRYMVRIKQHRHLRAVDALQLAEAEVLAAMSHGGAHVVPSSRTQLNWTTRSDCLAGSRCRHLSTGQPGFVINRLLTCMAEVVDMLADDECEASFARLSPLPPPLQRDMAIKFAELLRSLPTTRLSPYRSSRTLPNKDHDNSNHEKEQHVSAERRGDVNDSADQVNRKPSARSQTGLASASGMEDIETAHLAPPPWVRHECQAWTSEAASHDSTYAESRCCTAITNMSSCNSLRANSRNSSDHEAWLSSSRKIHKNDSNSVNIAPPNRSECYLDSSTAITHSHYTDRTYAQQVQLIDDLQECLVRTATMNKSNICVDLCTLRRCLALTERQRELLEQDRSPGGSDEHISGETVTATGVI